MSLCPNCLVKLDQSNYCSKCGYKTLTTSRSKRVMMVLLPVVLVAVVSLFFFRGFLLDFFMFSKPAVASANEKIEKVVPPEKPVVQGLNPTLSIEELEALRELFERGDFLELNQQLKKLQNEFEIDIRQEWKTYQVFQMFRNARADYKSLLDAWIKEQPEEYSPYLARAYHFSALAADSRGANPASETSSQEFERMRKFNSLAFDDISKALSINKQLLPAYCLLIVMHNTQGDEFKEEKVFNVAEKLFPSSLHLYRTYQWANGPRWGGSLERMNEIALKASNRVGENPELYWLTGYIYCDVASYARSRQEYDMAMNLYAHALSYGENSYFYEQRGYAYVQMRELDKALSDLNRSVELRPSRFDSYKRRAYILKDLQRYEEALDDVVQMGRISPKDRSSRKLHRWAMEFIKDNPGKNYSLIEEKIRNAAYIEVRNVGSISSISVQKPQKPVINRNTPKPVEILTSKNLLVNGDASQGDSGWIKSGSAEMLSDEEGNRYFSLKNGGSIQQTIFMSPDREYYAVLIGTMNTERVGVFTGLPVIWGAIRNIDENGKKSTDYLQGEKMNCTANNTKDWVVGYGIYPVKETAVSVEFKLSQATRKGIPHNGSSANIDDAGLYLFESRQAAVDFIPYYEKEISSRISQEK